MPVLAEGSADVARIAVLRRFIRMPRRMGTIAGRHVRLVFPRLWFVWRWPVVTGSVVWMRPVIPRLRRSFGRMDGAIPVRWRRGHRTAMVGVVIRGIAARCQHGQAQENSYQNT